MDISETYIKMRLAAIPDLGTGIKALHPACDMSEDGNVWVDSKADWYYSPEPGADYCQLERQDQLQEMVDSHIQGSPWYIIGEFNEFIGTRATNIGTYKYATQFTSMEQLWLAFIIKEKYNKVWAEEKWEVAGN